jgi:hypothetical protein
MRRRRHGQGFLIPREQLLVSFRVRPVERIRAELRAIE